MKYDFDQVVNRRGSGCYKWDSESPLPVVDGPQPEDNVTNDIIPMWVADMDFQVAPAIREALQRRVEHGVFGYTLVPDSYYQAIINWFRRRHDWQIEREWIMYTTGVVPALSVIVKAFTQPGDQVILQTPVYNCFFSSVRNNGCEVVESPLIPASSFSPSWKYTMDFADLEAKVRHPRAKLLILCNPHNPVGRVWTREELARIARICKENDVIVVADEIHNELCFRGRRYVPYCTIDKLNAIICTSPS